MLLGRIRTHCFQYLETIEPRQVEIEQHHRGLVVAHPAGVCSTTEQIIERLDAVVHPNDVIFDPRTFKGHPRQLGIIVVILDEQDHRLHRDDANTDR